MKFDEKEIEDLVSERELSAIDHSQSYFSGELAFSEIIFIDK